MIDINKSVDVMIDKISFVSANAAKKSALMDLAHEIAMNNYLTSHQISGAIWNMIEKIDEEMEVYNKKQDEEIAEYKATIAMLVKESDGGENDV